MSDEVQPLPSAPILRRLWVVVLLTCLLVTFPLAMILLLTGDVYRWKDHGFRPIGKGARFVYGGLLALWQVALVAKAVLSPASIKEEWAKSADPDTPAHQATPNAAQPPDRQYCGTRQRPFRSCPRSNHANRGWRRTIRYPKIGSYG